MSTRRTHAEALLWTLTACAVIAIALQGRPRTSSAPSQSQARPIGVTPTLWSPDSLLAWSERVHGAPPFRLDRRAPVSAPGGDGFVVPPPIAPPPEPPRPAPTLSGIVGASGAWSAVLSGVPGVDADVLVRAGDTLPGGLLIRRIRGDTVVVDAADTTWILVARRTW